MGAYTTWPIECDCTSTNVTIYGDPYSGITSVTTIGTSHQVNRQATFFVGILEPDGTWSYCSELVSIDRKSYLIDTIDLTTSLDLPGVGSTIDLNWIYISPARGYIVYNRGDGWETYCDGIVLEVNPRINPAPC